jgi:ribosomal protein S18 acetylase RimI-like enzyme
MTLPPVTFELVRRLEDAALQFGVARLGAIRDRPETGLDLRIERFGAAIAPASPTQPELDFVNRIEGFGIGDVARLDQILDFYGSLGIDPWLELAPEAGVEEIGTMLARAGARIVGFHAVLYARPRRAPSGAVDVRRTGGTEGEAAARILLEGHAVPEVLRPTHGSALAAAVEQAEGSLYVATVGGLRAAAAVLTIADGIGYLANAATLPAFRRRGCQRALIAARVADAADAGCDLVTSGAEFGSYSQRNLERAGFRLAYMKPVLRLTARAGSARTCTARLEERHLTIEPE